MAYYPPDVIQKVKEIDLYTYLKNYEPDELVPFSRGTYMTRTHDSLKISNGMWYWFSQGVGGKTALEYLIRVRDYSFIEAVEIILGKSKISPLIQYKQKEKLQNVRLLLPKKASDNEQVIKYLVDRGIDKDIIQECIDNDLIYQQYQNNNVVFVGYDKFKTPRYAGVRATNSSRYMQDAYGSHKAFSFKLDSLDKNDSVHLFESAIDLLSYATLLKLDNKEWYNENLLSLAGVYQPAKKIDESKIPLALNYYLNQNQNIKKIVLHFDNDSAGRIATMALKTILPKQYEVVDDPPKVGKDFNDFLCDRVGINYKKRYGKER
ncbi:MAG: toprim domain-containing protein [Clostridia bacterium]|nr:toprim domain-containing protein [Clostridia bacterium]